MNSDYSQNRLKHQLAVTSALIIREMTTRYGNKFGGYLWAVLDPVLTIAIMTTVFSAIAKVPPLGRDFVLFFASGYASFYMYRSMSEQVATAVSSNQALLNYPIVRPYDTIIARILLQIMTLFMVNLLLFGAIALMTDIGSIRIDKILLSSLISTTLGAGVGISNIVWFHFSSTFQQVWGIINRPAFIVSGVFFLPESLPYPFNHIILWNPLVHVIGLFRAGIYPNYRAAYVDLWYVGGLAIFSVVFGLTMVWLFDAKLREPK